MGAVEGNTKAASDYVNELPYTFTEQGDLYTDDQVKVAWLDGRIAGLKEARDLLEAASS